MVDRRWHAKAGTSTLLIPALLSTFGYRLSTITVSAAVPTHRANTREDMSATPERFVTREEGYRSVLRPATRNR